MSETTVEPPDGSGARSRRINMHHTTDIVALLFGLAFAITGAGFLVHEATGRAVDPAWVAAIGFVALGLIALVLTLFRAKDEA